MRHVVRLAQPVSASFLSADPLLVQHLSLMPLHQERVCRQEACRHRLCRQRHSTCRQMGSHQLLLLKLLDATQMQSAPLSGATLKPLQAMGVVTAALTLPYPPQALAVFNLEATQARPSSQTFTQNGKSSTDASPLAARLLASIQTEPLPMAMDAIGCAMHLLHRQARLVLVQRASHSALALMLLDTACTCTDLPLESAANMRPAGSNQPQKAQVLVCHQPSDLQPAALHKQLWMTLHIQQTHAAQHPLIHMPSGSALMMAHCQQTPTLPIGNVHTSAETSSC